MVSDGDQPCRVPLPDEVQECLEKGEIDITEGEIQDRSKGDMLSKGLVIIQTGWFILQCLARQAAHLPITELELITLAFATLNFMTYIFWWNKPLNVLHPVRIHRGRSAAVGKEGSGGADWDEAEAGSDDDSEGKVGRPSAAVREVFAAIGRTICKTASNARRTPRYMIRCAVDYVQNEGLWRIIRFGVLFPFKLVSVYQVDIFVRLGGGEKALEYGAQRVPTFYAGELIEQDNWIAAGVAVFIAMIFGGIHCFAWTYDFPSHTERLLWRISCLAITFVPAVPLVFAWLFNVDLTDFTVSPKNRLGWLCFVGGCIPYILARFVLLTLAFVALRALPPKAYQTVPWSTFIPHVSV